MRTIETSLGSVELDAIPAPRLKTSVGARQLNPLELELALECIRRGEPVVATLESSGDASKINLNAADKAVLVLLPGVGIKTAERIIEARPIGSFHDLETVDIELTAEAKRLVSF